MNLTIILFAFFLSITLTYFIQKLFISFKKFDDFNVRSSHKALATRTGGITIFLSLLIISLYFYFQKIEIFDYSIFIPLGIMFIVGVYDDFYNADFKLKFFLQIIVAKIIIDQGYVISNFHGFLGLYDIPWIFAQMTTVFVFLIIVNAINFIDGIDGLAITEVLKFLFLFECFSLSDNSFSNLSLLLPFILLPLYFFNFKKNKKVFLGDGGSLFLGTLIAIYIFYLLGDKYEITINKVFYSIIILLYPLIDLLRVFIIRIKNDKSPFIPDQNHLHHILHKRGYHPIINVLLIQIISLIFIFIGTSLF